MVQKKYVLCILFLDDYIFLKPNLRVIDSNLLNKDKFERKWVNLEKTLKMGGGFKILIKNSI